MRDEFNLMAEYCGLHRAVALADAFGVSRTTATRLLQGHVSRRDLLAMRALYYERTNAADQHITVEMPLEVRRDGYAVQARHITAVV